MDPTAPHHSLKASGSLGALAALTSSADRSGTIVLVRPMTPELTTGIEGSLDRRSQAARPRCFSSMSGTRVFGESSSSVLSR